MAVEAIQQHFRQFTDARFIGRVADIDDLAIAQVIMIFNYAK